ncbi:MAG: response regulator, partial [Bacteroidota bacterium]
EALLNALNNSAIVSITDLNGKIISVNTIFCQVSGYNEEELIGQNHNIINSGFHDNAFWKDLWTNILAGKTWRAEICNRAKDGSIYWVDTVINPIYGQNGEIHQFLAIRYLITQRKEAEENLAKAKDVAESSLRVKRRFLANMSHEIRTPLHAILGLGEQIMQGIKEESQKEQMKLINESAKALLSIINDIIDISRIEEGKMKLDYVPFDLEHIVNSVFKLLQTYAHKKALHFELMYDPELDSKVVGDPVRLRQILINVLGNAIKFTEKGMVRLHCKVAKKEGKDLLVSFLCEDTGIGISDDMKKRMFQDFSQEDETYQRKFGGSGLGLAITSELVKLMGGIIDIESQKNTGTKVFISIPMEINIKPEKKFADHIPIEKEKLKHINVLVAEDNQFNRVLIQIIFNNNQIQYDMAVNGLEAFEMATKEKYDIILMDIQMPEMDGIEAMQKIRASKNNKIPMIAVTANAIPEELNHYLELGFNDFITKPFTEENLLLKMLKFV